MNPVVLVLASGRGERFLASGGSTHKLQALLGNKTVLQHTLDAVRASGLPYHLEHAGHPGMGDSIAAAVRATADADGWLILPADLPLVLPETLRRVATAPAEQALVRPVYQGRHGHPVRFARACAAALLALTGETGAAPVVRQFGVTELQVDDAGCVTDIDTVQDLQQALQILRSRAAQ
ncbi:MAG: NTP transferase domain-containing protein [Hylemonella sp.]|nr:NTP transferase domain-containing protein [Hylemonella sp.]